MQQSIKLKSTMPAIFLKVREGVTYTVVNVEINLE
jgi:hypothetical protein